MDTSNVAVDPMGHFRPPLTPWDPEGLPLDPLLAYPLSPWNLGGLSLDPMGSCRPTPRPQKDLYAYPLTHCSGSLIQNHGSTCGPFKASLVLFSPFQPRDERLLELIKMIRFLGVEP